MEEMSWLEISEALKSGVNTAIIPLGSVEQHGHHLPLLTDTIEAHYLSEMIAQEVGFALVAPAIRPGYSEHHMDFPGTISLRLETLASIIRDYCASLIHHGFKNIVMLNCHGGNIPVLSAVAAEFAMAHAKDGITVISIVDVLSEIFTCRDRDKIGHPEGWPEGIHGGKYETSFILAYRPELVNMHRATTEWPEGFMTYETEANEELMMFVNTKGMKHFTKSGIIGDGKSGDAKYGQCVAGILAKNIAEFLRRTIENESKSGSSS